MAFSYNKVDNRSEELYVIYTTFSMNKAYSQIETRNSSLPSQNTSIKQQNLPAFLFNQ